MVFLPHQTTSSMQEMKGARMATEDKSPDKVNRVQLDLAVHRRVLNFLNEGIRPQDLMYEKLRPPNPEMDPAHEEHDTAGEHAGARVLARRKILDQDIAEEIIEFRDREFPLGFRNVRELFVLKGFDLDHLDVLRHNFSNSFYGSWSLFPQNIPRRGPGGYDGVVHAALLHTGKVLFITADETTLLWNPNDSTPATFEDPLNQPHLTPDAATGYSVLCGGHSFLSDGRLLVVGGGGYQSHSLAKWGYIFDPTSKRWKRTSGSMVHDRWYPTVLTLGDGRIGDSHEVLVVCGHGAGDMEIYDEASDSFQEVTSGDVKPFPNLYPGLHQLPDSRIFYSRTGWGSAGPGNTPAPVAGDDQSAYFVLTGITGAWNDIAAVTPLMPDRTKGMSVMLLSRTPPHVRILVLGGFDPSNNNTYEIIDATALSATTNWGTSTPFPDGEHRSLGSAVLLPDGQVFVCGGIQQINSPCALFDPRTNSWSAMAALPSIRDYHSVALLLPSAQVAMAGWNNTSIEIFNPPYLYRGVRPVISSAPSSVQRGQDFEIGSPDAATITSVVLARPMAVTHQTDTEQKILEMPYVAVGFSTFGTLDTSGAVTDRFGVGKDHDALAFVSEDLGYGPDFFYYLRHDAAGFSTFGTIDTNGGVTDRFGVGNHFDALTFAAQDLGYGPNLFYCLRHDAAGFSTFGTIDTNGAVTDRFGVGNHFDALTFAPGNRGYGPNLFYYLRHDAAGFSTFGTIATSGAVTDRFAVGNHFDALTFAPGNRGYGPNLFYYLRHDAAGFSTFGTIATSGAVTDRFAVGNHFDALTFAPGNRGYGPNLFYYLRRDIIGLTVTAPDENAPHALAQQGYYMMFAMNNHGVPSVARWIYLD
jgi:Galactose oxidase-like, Early set domain